MKSATTTTKLIKMVLNNNYAIKMQIIVSQLLAAGCSIIPNIFMCECVLLLAFSMNTPCSESSLHTVFTLLLNVRYPLQSNKVYQRKRRGRSGEHRKKRDLQPNAFGRRFALYCIECIARSMCDTDLLNECADILNECVLVFVQ